jgi:hypothetical protein
MKSESKIIAGGGWIIREVVGKPRARLFAAFSLGWLSVSIFASRPFWDGWPRSFGWHESLSSLLLLPEPLFQLLALVYLVVEQPRAILEKRPNPDYDIQNLY